MLYADTPELLFTEFVSVVDRLRQVNEGRVAKLAESMKEIGLQTPITVRSWNDGEKAFLVAGLHRLEAAKQLGWERIPVIFVTGTDDDFRLWEIAENLHRSELTVDERSSHIAEWIRLTDKTIQEKAGGVEQPAQKCQIASKNDPFSRRKTTPMISYFISLLRYQARRQDEGLSP